MTDMSHPRRSPITPDLRGRGAAGSLLRRIWQALHAIGQRRAAEDLAWHVRLYGGEPTGDLARDARQLAGLRGFR